MANQLKALESATGCIDDYCKELTARQLKASEFREAQKVAVEFIQAFPEDYAEHEWEQTKRCVGFSLDVGTWQRVHVSWDATTMAEVVEPLRWLAQRLGAYAIEDDPDLKRRIYKFNCGTFLFQVFFWGPDDQQQCKYVQVGVKETPVFELRCGDSAPTEEVKA